MYSTQVATRDQSPLFTVLGSIPSSPIHSYVIGMILASMEWVGDAGGVGATRLHERERQQKGMSVLAS